MAHLTTWLRTRRFSEPLFDLREPQIIRVKRDFLPFGAPDLLSSSLLLLGSSHLCFSICPYCRRFDFQTSFDHHVNTVYLLLLFSQQSLESKQGNGTLFERAQRLDTLQLTSPSLSVTSMKVPRTITFTAPLELLASVELLSMPDHYFKDK